MRCCPLCIAVALHLVVVLVASIATAAPPARRRGARIAWVRGVAADRCVGLGGLEEDVKLRLGYDPLVLPSELGIEGVVVRAAAGFRAELVVRDAEGKVLGSRQLASSDADCRALGEAVAVAITVAIDPDIGGARNVDVNEGPVTLAPVEPVQPCPQPRPPPPARPEERGRAALSAGASAGLVPDTSLVTSLHARAAVSELWDVGVGASFWPESQTAGLGFAIASAALESCIAPLASARFLRWCAAVHVGLFQVFVHAPELSPVDVGMFPWVAGETGPSVSLALVGRLRLEASVSAIVPFLRRQAFLRGQAAPVWEQNAFGGRAELGLGAGF